MGHKYIKKVRTKSGKWRYIYKDYRKALSSKDERDKYITSQGVGYGHVDEVTSVDKKGGMRDSYIVKKYTNKERKMLADNMYGLKKEAGILDKTDKKARKNYDEAKTIKGKTNAVRKVFNKHNPETAKKISNGKKRIKRILDRF